MLVFNNCKINNIILVLAIVVLLLSNDRIYNTFCCYKENNNKSIEYRNQYLGLENYREFFQENDRIYIVIDYQGEISEKLKLEKKRTLDFLSIRYQIAPFFVAKLAEENVELQKVEEKLRCGYTYVYFHKCQKDTIEKYTNLLEDKNKKIEEGMLFKVLYNDNNELRIRCVE